MAFLFTFLVLGRKSIKKQGEPNREFCFYKLEHALKKKTGRPMCVNKVVVCCSSTKKR